MKVANTSLTTLLVVSPAVAVGFDVVAAAMVPAVDQHVADATGARLGEGYFCGEGVIALQCNLIAI